MYPGSTYLNGVWARDPLTYERIMLNRFAQLRERRQRWFFRNRSALRSVAFTQHLKTIKWGINRLTRVLADTMWMDVTSTPLGAVDPTRYTPPQYEEWGWVD